MTEETVWQIRPPEPTAVRPRGSVKNKIWCLSLSAIGIGLHSEREQGRRRRQPPNTAWTAAIRRSMQLSILTKRAQCQTLQSLKCKAFLDPIVWLDLPNLPSNRNKLGHNPLTHILAFLNVRLCTIQ